MNTTHVFPIDDLFPHEIEDGPKGFAGECCCNPRKIILPNGNMTVIHNSFDHRELFEQLDNRYLKYFQ